MVKRLVCSAKNNRYWNGEESNGALCSADFEQVYLEIPVNMVKCVEFEMYSLCAIFLNSGADLRYNHAHNKHRL